MKKQTTSRPVTNLMTLTVFFLFALCLLLVLLTGARIYRSTVQAGEEGFETRTAAQYLTTRVRQWDCRGQLSVESFGGCDALVFRETAGTMELRTLVYCWDGSLRELLCTGSGEFVPGDGQILFPLQSLSLTLDEDLLLAELTLPGGGQVPVTLQVRTAQEELP